MTRHGSPRAEAIARKVIDFTSFVDSVAELPAGSLAHAKRRVVAYHDSCQGLNALGSHEAPRRILGEVLGHEVRNLAESRVCCGFGGSFSFDYPRISERLMNRKLDDAEATGALEIVTDNQGCIMQLRGGSDAQGRPLRGAPPGAAGRRRGRRGARAPRGGRAESCRRVQPIRIRWRRSHLNPGRRRSSSISTTPCATMPRPARHVCGGPSRSLKTAASNRGSRIDLDRMIAESIRMHPHGADHFEELFVRFGIADARQARAAANWYRKNRFHGLRLFPGVEGVFSWCERRVSLTIPRRIARSGS